MKWCGKYLVKLLIFSVKYLLRALFAIAIIMVVVITIFGSPYDAYAISFNAEVTMSEPPSKVKDFEHCSIDPDKLAAIGRDVGQQVKIIRDRENYAIYTVKEKKPESLKNNVVRVKPEGLEKLGVTSETIAATVESQVPYASCLNNERCISDAQIKMMSEFVERLDDDGTNTSLVIIAPHGGGIEVDSDTVAEKTLRNLETIGKSVSYWRCKGWKKRSGDYRRWHITSTDINEASFPLLNTIINRHFDYAISFHGFNRKKRPEGKQHIYIWIGGRANSSLKRELRDLIKKNVPEWRVEVSGDLGRDDPFSATNKHNIVNRLAKVDDRIQNAIQIEMAEEIRSDPIVQDKIAEAVKTFYESKI
jgi:phage replication-related protein YjqB (UPF0714/DUF867 family)/Sec-independent protein translocase protein TatA